MLYVGYTYKLGTRNSNLCLLHPERKHLEYVYFDEWIGPKSNTCISMFDGIINPNGPYMTEQSAYSSFSFVTYVLEFHIVQTLYEMSVVCLGNVVTGWSSNRNSSGIHFCFIPETA